MCFIESLAIYKALELGPRCSMAILHNKINLFLYPKVGYCSPPPTTKLDWFKIFESPKDDLSQYVMLRKECNVAYATNKKLFSCC